MIRAKVLKLLILQYSHKQTMEQLLIAIVFSIAFVYMVRRVSKSFQGSTCEDKCAGCSSIDFSKIDTSKFEQKAKTEK